MDEIPEERASPCLGSRAGAKVSTRTLHGGQGTESPDCVTRGGQGFKTREKPLVLISQEAPGDVFCWHLFFLLDLEHRSQDLRAILALTLVWYRPGIHSAQEATVGSVTQSPGITCFPGKQAKIKKEVKIGITALQSICFIGKCVL